MRRWKRRLSVLLAMLLIVALMPSGVYQVQAASSGITLTFSDSGITETVSGSGYTIEGTALTIKSAGVYTVTGSCSSGSITVKKETTGVVLILDNLTLASTSTAPITVKKSSEATIHLKGTSTLTDSEDASTESTNTDYEGAAIKAKSGSSLTICGDGTLNVYGNSKNGIKGASTASLLVRSGNIQVKNAVKNGIAFDGNVTVNGENIGITASGDGIKAVPDEDATEAEELEAAKNTEYGNMTINGGAFDIDVNGDGITAHKSLTINNGTFDIQTMDGYNDSSFNASTMSCKGLKVSNDLTTDTEEMTINGGTFTLNTADDAIHSDGNIGLYGGTFTISAGDDGIHSDTYLQLGKSDGYERDPDVTINNSYEGLESGTINSYSGRYYVVAKDDGMNSAGGNNGENQGGNDHFNPGGGPGGGGPGGGGFRFNAVTAASDPNMTSSGGYNLNLAGGEFYVNCDGDGLDANGSLTITGGTYTVLSQEGGRDNSPLDANSTPVIKGGTVFLAGGQGMDGAPSVSGQSYKSSSSSYSSGQTIVVQSGNTVVHTEKLTKKVTYLLYTDPTITSSATIATGTYDSCKSNSWAHKWGDGATSGNVTTYTCQTCGATEHQTYAKAAADVCGGHTDSESNENTDTTGAYTASFSTDDHATVDIYYTQDYTTANETGVTKATARNSETGEADTSGSGQINFKVNCDSGYEIDSVTVTPTANYKNLKYNGNDTSIESGFYRVTKITGDLVITVVTKATENTTETTGKTDTTGTTDTTETTDTTGTKDTVTTVNNSATDTASQKTSENDTKTTETEQQVKKGKNTYKISGNSAALVKTQGTSKKLTVPAEIKVNGTTYKVTAISANACKGNKKLQQVVIGKNVKTIEKNAFKNCKSLKIIKIKGSVTSIAKSAFKGIKKNATFKVPKKYYKKLAKLIKKSGAKKPKIKKA